MTNISLPPNLQPFVTDCYQTGIMIPHEAGLDNLTVPVKNDSFTKTENSSEKKEPKKSHLGLIIAGLVGLAAGAAMCFKPTRILMKEGFGKISKKLGELTGKVGEFTAKREKEAVNKKVGKIASDILESEEPILKNKKIDGTKIKVHCGENGKPITFTEDHVKHLTPALDADGNVKEGVYKVLIGKDADGADQFAEMTLAKGKKDIHYITKLEKIGTEAPGPAPDVDVD